MAPDFLPVVYIHIYIYIYIYISWSEKFVWVGHRKRPDRRWAQILLMFLDLGWSPRIWLGSICTRCIGAGTEPKEGPNWHSPLHLWASAILQTFSLTFFFLFCDTVSGSVQYSQLGGHTNQWADAQACRHVSFFSFENYFSKETLNINCITQKRFVKTETLANLI